MSAQVFFPNEHAISNLIKQTQSKREEEGGGARPDALPLLGEVARAHSFEVPFPKHVVKKISWRFNHKLV